MTGRSLTHRRANCDGKMKIKILSCNTGGGHNTAARAIMECALQNGHEAEIIDYLDYFGKRTNRRICLSYVRAAKFFPWGFGAFYHFGKTVSRLLPKRIHSVVYHWSGKAAKKLGADLAKDPVDCIVSTHFLASEALVWLKDHGYNVPLTISVSTDYTCVPFWNEAECDVNVIPQEELLPEFLKLGLSKEKIVSFGIPVSLRFSENLPDAKSAREKLGLPFEKTVHLIMGGSMGVGHLKTLTTRLSEKLPDDTFIVVCGHNQRVADSLRERFKEKKNVNVLDFTEDIPTYMRACDVLYSKPGGLTSTEALTIGTALIHTAPIPGCESKNARFFWSHGLSAFARSTAKQVAWGKYLSEHPEEREKIRKNQKEYAKPDTAKNLVALMEERAGKPLSEKAKTE